MIYKLGHRHYFARLGFRIAYRSALFGFLLPVLYGCGADNRAELNSKAKIVTSIASEAGLLCEFAAGGHSTDSYLRIHTRLLKKQTENLLSDFGKEKVQADNQDQQQRLSRITTELREVLEQLPAKQSQTAHWSAFHTQLDTLSRASAATQTQ